MCAFPPFVSCAKQMLLDQFTVKEYLILIMTNK